MSWYPTWSKQNRITHVSMWKNPSPHLSLVVKVLLAAPTEAFFVDVENFYEKRLGAINPIEIIRNFPISMKKLVISYGNELNHKRSLPTFSKSSKTLLSIPYKVSRHRGQLGFRSNQGPWSHFKKKTVDVAQHRWLIFFFQDIKEGGCVLLDGFLFECDLCDFLGVRRIHSVWKNEP